MRILMVSPYSPAAVGGVGQFVHDLGIALHRKGHEVTALYRYERPEFELSQVFRDSVRSVEVRPWNHRGFRTVSANLQTSAWIRRHRTNLDVIHVLHIVPMSAMAIRSGHRHGIPSVATVYTRTPRSSRRLSHWVNEQSERSLLRDTDVLVFESSSTMRAFAPHSGRLILNGIDTEYFRPRRDLRLRVRTALEIPDDRFVILFLGRMDRMKGIYELLDALAILRRSSSAFVCLLVGSIEVADVPQRIEELGLADIVKIVGPVGKLDVLDYYCASDVFVLPSHLEGISSALIEAMACGLPVVATRVGGNPEVVRDNEDGILVEPGNGGSVAVALQGLMADPASAAAFGRNARARVQSLFSLSAMTDQYLRAYEDARSTFGKGHRLAPPGPQGI